MEYIVILSLLVIIGIMWFKKPNEVQNKLTEAIVNRVNESKDEIAEGVYNKLPDKVKEDVPKEMIIIAVTEILGIATEVIEDVLIEKS